MWPGDSGADLEERAQVIDSKERSAAEVDNVAS
jgi:hypothetical protein